MESFNPTPEWLGQGRDFIWSYAEIWGFPCVLHSSQPLLCLLAAAGMRPELVRVPNPPV